MCDCRRVPRPRRSWRDRTPALALLGFCCLFLVPVTWDGGAWIRGCESSTPCALSARCLLIVNYSTKVYYTKLRNALLRPLVDELRALRCRSKNKSLDAFRRVVQCFCPQGGGAMLIGLSCSAECKLQVSRPVCLRCCAFGFA